jgi:hypothetical protein
VREDRPSDYLKVIAMLVAKGDMTVNVTHFQDVEQFIEERRLKAVAMIARMQETPMPEDDANKAFRESPRGAASVRP